MYLWKPSTCPATGIRDPGAQSGQVGQPKPEPVNRTIAPVTMIPDWAIKLAKLILRPNLVLVVVFMIFSESRYLPELHTAGK
jgi:hypothetical protein